MAAAAIVDVEPRWCSDAVCMRRPLLREMLSSIQPIMVNNANSPKSQPKCGRGDLRCAIYITKIVFIPVIHPCGDRRAGRACAGWKSIRCDHIKPVWDRGCADEGTLRCNCRD